jgi:hypothetical protein
VLEGVGPLAGQAARANLYLETFETVGSQPIIKFGGEIAGVVRRAGKGRAWLVGTCLGHSGTAYRSAEGPAFVRALLETCGVRPAHAGKLLLRKRHTAGKEAWFFTNPTGEAITETVEVGSARVENLLAKRSSRTAAG